MKAKASRLDSYLISLMLVVFFYTGWKLFIEGFQAVSHVRETALASIKTINNTVKNKSGNLFAWSDAYSNQNLYSGDQIYTHEDSKVEVLFEDQSLLTLYENTLVKIEKSKSERIITLKDGIIFIRGRKKGKLKVRVRNSDLVLTSDLAKIQVKESEDKTDFLILEGSAEVEVNNQNFKVGANEYLSIGDNSTQISVKKLNYKILSPENESSFAKSSLVNFNWEKVDDQEISFQLSNDQNFKTSFINQKTTINNFSYKFEKAGLYFWKLSAEALVLPSEIRSLYIFEPIVVLSPLPGSIVTMKKPDSGLQFRWEAAENPRYLIEVSKDSEFKSIEFSRTSEEAHIVWEEAKTGDYFWRIKKLGNEKEDFSPAKEIFIRRPAPPQAPSIKKIPRLYKLKKTQEKRDFSLLDLFISPAYAEILNETELTWPKDYNAKEYLVEIYSDKNLTIPLLTKRVSENHLTWKNPKIGKFYWRLAIVDFWDQTSPFSETIEAEVLDQKIKINKKRKKKIVKKLPLKPSIKMDHAVNKKVEYFLIVDKIIDSYIEVYQNPTLVKFVSEQGRTNVNASGVTLTSTGLAYHKRLSKISAVSAKVERMSGTAFEANSYLNNYLALNYHRYFYFGQNSPLFYSLGILYDQQSYYLKKGLSELSDESMSTYAASFSLGIRFARKTTSFQKIVLSSFAGTSFGGSLEYNYSYLWKENFSLLGGVESRLKIFSTSENVDATNLSTSLKLGARYHF